MASDKNGGFLKKCAEQDKICVLKFHHLYLYLTTHIGDRKPILLLPQKGKGKGLREHTEVNPCGGGKGERRGWDKVSTIDKGTFLLQA